MKRWHLKTVSPRLVTMWLIVIMGSVATSAAIDLLHLPAAFLLGSVLFSAAMALKGMQLRVAPTLTLLAQAGSGCLVGAYMTADVLSDVLAIWPVVLFTAAVTIVVSLIVGYSVGRLAKIDLRIAIWGFIPGMSSNMIIMADERGVDGRLVAMMQLLRLVVVIFATALLGGVSGSGDVLPPPHVADASSFATCLLIVLISAIASRFVTFIPGAAFLLPLFVAAAVTLSGSGTVQMPATLFNACLTILGMQVGLRITPQIIRVGITILPYCLLGCGLLLAFCAILGGMLYAIGAGDLYSALLATAPGSIETISALAVSSGAAVTFVVAVQTVRVIVLSALGPFLADYTARLVGNRHE